MSTETLKEKVKRGIISDNLIKEGDYVIVGLSGGADSTCLFVVLNELKEELGFHLYALHVEHGIRGEESIEDAEFSRGLSEKYNVPFKMVSIDIPTVAKERRLGTEEAARIERYKVFEDFAKELCETNNTDFSTIKTAVAHHANDNAETILFNMTRGSGIDGAAGIKPITTRKSGLCIIRPLYFVTRREIEEFLSNKGENYCIDKTNEDTNYSRNRIRNIIIPEFEKINEAAVGHFLNFSREMLEIKKYLDIETDRFMENACKISVDGVGETVVSLDVKKLEKADPVIRRRTLKKAIVTVAKREKDIEKRHVADLETLMGLQSGRGIDLPYALRARKEYERIIIEKKDSTAEDGAGCTDIATDCLSFCEMLEKRTFQPLPWEECKALIPKNVYTKWLDYDKIKGELSARFPNPGDRICIDVAGHTKDVFDYLKNEKVSAADRKRTIVIADDEEIVWVPGHRISEKYKITPETKTVIEVKYVTEKEM
ncbi:MAG: tRNA lysidine(34) synthetase TilS [Lachnospiraceae bacterium]|nr:tRNA lysidine(34) synthetase TilS [Lachnospiraceae bacterium]